MEFIETLARKAASNPRNVVLPEGEDKRVITAASNILRKKAAAITLMGNEAKIRAAALEIGADITGAEIKSIGREEAEKYAEKYLAARKSRGKDETLSDALELMQNPVFFAAMMVRESAADGMTAGCLHYSSTVMRAAYRAVGLAENTSLFSSFLVVSGCRETLGENGALVLSDPSVNPEPDARQLAIIAVSTAKSAGSLFGWEPRIAMLSYSTKGSSPKESPEKVRKALDIARRMMPGAKIDGELQADAALVPGIARRKGAGNTVAGKANILVFPNLDAANISYKLIQHIAGVNCYGPVLQGFARPVNDLSRGSSAEDIEGVILITALQAAALTG